MICIIYITHTIQRSNREFDSTTIRIWPPISQQKKRYKPLCRLRGSQAEANSLARPIRMATNGHSPKTQLLESQMAMRNFVRTTPSPKRCKKLPRHQEKPGHHIMFRDFPGSRFQLQTSCSGFGVHGHELEHHVDHEDDVHTPGDDKKSVPT